MSVKEQIDAELLKARVERDQAIENVINILRQQVQKELDDDPKSVEEDLWLRNVEAYAQQLRKAMAEFEALGDKALVELARARFEFGFVERVLPKRIDADATQALIPKLEGD